MTGFSQRLLDPSTHMDMFQVFKHHFVQELGPLCPNWFDELTVSAARDEASAQDPETSRETSVQEASLKTPLREPAVDSQIFSTPKLFKSPVAQSPEPTTDEDFFSPDRGAVEVSKTVPWMDTSMAFFGSAKSSHADDKLCNTSLAGGDFGNPSLLNVPKSLAAVSVKSISESLGAQLNPDMSWTSSLNTPPAMSPTVILTKEEDKAQPVSPSGDKRVILVRELFPSISKVSRITEISSEKPGGLLGPPSEVKNQVGGLMMESGCQPLPSLEEKDGLWKQTLPDAIQDGEVRSTVANVLDGAEDALSIFFSNGGSALRRVKAKERSSRRRQASTVMASELAPLECGSPEDPAKMAAPSERAMDTFTFHEGNSPETKDCGITQWTPLTLADVTDPSAVIDFCAEASFSDRADVLVTDEPAERLVDEAQLEKLTVKDVKNKNSDIMPGGALAHSDASVANTQGKKTGPSHSASLHQRTEDSKQLRYVEPQPVMLPPSKHCWDHGTMPTSSPGDNVRRAERQSGMLAPQPSQPLLPGTEVCPALAPTRKPPRKFVYSLPSPRLSRQAKHNRTADSHAVSTPTVPLPGECLNVRSSRCTGIYNVKTHHNDNVTEGESECKRLCEQAGNTSMGLVPAASNEAESGLHYVPLLCPASTEEYSQARNPGTGPSCSTDVLGCDTDTSFSATACLAVMRSKRPSRLSPTNLTKKPGSADDYRDCDIIDCPDRSIASIQTSGMCSILGESDTTRVTFANQSRDSGYHTTGSDATQLHGSSDIRDISSAQKVAENPANVGFKMVSNRIIAVSQEALQRAKALLDEGPENRWTKSNISKGKGPQLFESRELNHKSHCKGTKSSSVGNSAASRHSTLPNKASSPHSSLSSFQGSSPNPVLVGFKTASNTTICLSSANLLKAKQLFKDIENEELSEGSLRSSCTDFNSACVAEAESGTSKSSAGLMAAPLITWSSTERKGSEAYGCLTASQRADVTELCSLLEEADSQFEFTQFKQAKSTSTGSDEVTCNDPCDKEVDPDFLTGIDFDDSFSSDCDRQAARKQRADAIMPDKLTASSYYKQHGRDHCFKTKPEVSSCDSNDKIAECPDALHLENQSASSIPVSNYDLGSFVAFSSASGKKITVSKEVLKRASKVFEDLDIVCGPSETSARDRSTDPSHLAAQGAAVPKVQRARNVPGPNVTFKSPKSNANNHNHCMKKASLLPGAIIPEERSLEVCAPSRDARTVWEADALSAPNLPLGEPGPAVIDSSYQMPPVKNHLEGSETPSGTLLPLSVPGVTDGLCDECPPSTPALNSAVGDTQASLQRDTGENLDISYLNHPNSATHGAGFKTARGTVVSVSERLLGKAREMFADLEENLEGTHGQGYCVEQKRSKAVMQNKVLPDKCADMTDKAEATSLKCKSENEAVQRTSADHDTDEPDAVQVEKQLDMTSVHSRAETPDLNGEINVGCSTPCVNKVGSVEKALVETTSNQCVDISGSFETTVASGEGSSNVSTRNTQGNCGFSTAGGKKVTVSEKSLKYAQSLLNECAEMKIPEFEMTSSFGTRQVSSHSLRVGNGGFRTAGGKGVSISPNALEQAKAMFQSCNDGAKCEITEEVIGDCMNGKTRGRSMIPMPTSSGFSDKGLPISSKALLEIKDMFEEGDKNAARATTDVPREGNTNAKSFELNCNLGKVNCGFRSAGGKLVSVSEKAFLRANALLKECDDEQHLEPKRLGFMAHSTPAPHLKGGFSTASGKGVSISLKALREAKARFADCNDDTLPEIGEVKAESCKNTASAHKNNPMKSGFSTASGQGVSVSKNALLKAKKLLDECCDVESGEPGRPLKMKCTTSSVPNPMCESKSGFSTGGAMGLSNSVNNIYEADLSIKDDLNDRNTAEIQANHLKVKGGSYNNAGKCPSGFSTARGARVSVSVKALEEAKAKFRECDDLDHVFVEEMKVGSAKNDSTHHTQNKIVSDISTAVENAVSKNGLQSTSLMPVKCDGIHRSAVPSASEHLPRESVGQATDRRSAQESRTSSALQSGSPPTHDHPVSGEAPVGIENCRTTQRDKGLATRRSSPLNLRSLELGDCTDTQQTYLEQEAMACTRALLEDEDLTEEDLQEAPGKTPPPQNAAAHCSAVAGAEGSRGPGKRLKSEDSDFTAAQPPLKRRLLAEFDRSSDCDKEPVFAPVKSSPNVVLRDRRIFRYGVPLQPNVTRPPGDKKGALDHRQKKAEPQIVVPGSFLQDVKPANPRGALFVPPFRKGPKPEVQETGLPPESRAPASTFVPPFRKTQPNSTPLAQGPGQPSSSQSGAPLVPAVFVPPPRNRPGSAPHPGSEERMCIQEPGTHSACANADTAQHPVIPNVPAGGGNEPGGPTLAPPSPGGQDASSSAAQTIQKLQLARDLQDMRIRKKKRKTIRPQPGSLFLAKTSGVARVSLRSAVGGRCPGLHTPKELYTCGVPHGVSQIGSDNAESFRFRCRDFFREEALLSGGGVPLADGGRLVPSNDGTAGKEEFYRALCDTPGVDPKLICEGWLYNHYRWVVWKRASMERAFPSVMGGYCLTPEQVLLQLKYRYDVEVDLSRRSALRRIMERDDTPAKTMVLCVCGVASPGSAPAAGPVQPESRASPGPGAKAGGSPGGVIWVTDGWYAIKAQLDGPLTALLQKGRLAVGGKVVTHGAELVGSQDACTPLEAPESLMLKISANSTRPARWDARLGFHRDPRPFRLPLSSLYCNGGLVGCVDILVMRTYPTQWMEKKPGGVFVFRNDRAEEREARRHSDSKHKAMEVLFARVQAQFEKEQETKTKAGSRRRRLTRQEVQALQDGEELQEAVEADPVYMESCLSEQQLAVLSSYRESLGQERQVRLQERFRQALTEAQEQKGGCPDRDVTPVWKLSVCDFGDQQGGDVYLLSVWRPSGELRSLLREGCRYRAYQLSTSQGKRQSGRAAVQLTATKKTHFQHIQVPLEAVPKLFQPRVAASFPALQSSGFHPVCGEVDVVGYVVSIADRLGPSPVLYLADGRQDLVSVRMRASLAQLALEELVKPQALLALSNLQLGHRAPASLPALYAGELALVSTNPKEPHLQEACAHLRSVAQGNDRFFQVVEEKLAHFVPPNCPSSLLSPKELGPSPKRVNGQIPQQLVRTPGLFTPVSKKPPLPAATPDDRDPKSMKRKRGLDFLSRIPSPPPLSPLWTGASPALKKTFNPPRRSETPRPARSRPALPPTTPPCHAPPPQEPEWVHDEELAMINTQALMDGVGALEGMDVSR